MTAPKSKRLRKDKFHPLAVTVDRLADWFAEAGKHHAIPVPTTTALQYISELLECFQPPQVRTFKSQIYGRQFLLELNREADELIQALALPLPHDTADDFFAMLNATQPGLGDRARDDRLKAFEDAYERLKAARDATASFLNHPVFLTAGKHPLWHHVALHIDQCAVWGWGGPAVAGSPTPDSPRVRFVASALSELGYLPPKKDAWDEDTISAVLSGKRGPGSNFPEDKKIQ